MATSDSPGPGQQIESNTNTPSWTVAYNWVKLQRKIITYLITWDIGKVVLHPHISGIFLGNLHLHDLIKFPKYSQFYAWFLLSILLICGSSLHALYFSIAPIDINRKPPHIRRIESKYQAWNWLLEIELVCVNAHFLKDARNVWMKKDNISNISYELFFFVILLNCRPPFRGRIAFNLPAGTWACSGCHRQPLCCRWHLRERHCIMM